MYPTSPTRRDLLQALLGAPAAWAAGCAREVPSSFTGSLVGASDTVGHRLRDRAPPTPAADDWERTRVVIVGGGIAGLSAAWRLRRSGVTEFVLLELEPDAGGTSRYGTGPVVPYPWGAHYLPAPLKENADLVTLLDELGVVEGRDGHGEPVIAEQVLCRDPQERVYYKGAWYEGLYLHAGESPEDQAHHAAFWEEVNRWVGWRDGRGRRAFAIPVAAGSDDAEVTALDRVTMAEWLDRRGLTSPRLRWLVNYACRDDYGATLDQVSAWAGLFYFASRLRQPGAEAQPLLTWPEGNGRIVRHLLDRVRGHVRTGWAVADVNPVDAEGRPAVEVVAVDASGQRVLGLRADRVVFAAPHFLTRYLIRPYRAEPPRHVAAFDYGAWMVANLHLTDRPRGRGFPLAWDNVLYDSPSLGYVVATHQRGLDFGPTVCTYYYPLCDESPRLARTKLLGVDWQGWADVALTDLRRAHPQLPGLVRQLDVMRWGHAMVRPRPGFVWGGARAAALRPYRGIHFAHADLSGVALFEEAFYHGVRAADEVLAAQQG